MTVSSAYSTSHSGVAAENIQGNEPYLFTLVLSHIMEQVDKEYENKYGSLPWISSAATPLWDVEYADDTVIL
ncbi:MAG: hypothetical protein ACKO96_29175, partial [Flammeovirgaceae bacterium]